MYTQKINLMPRKDEGDVFAGRFRYLTIILSIFVIAILLVAGVLYYAKNNLLSKEKELDDKIAQIDADIKRNTDIGIDDFKKRAASVTQLLNNHFYWSKLFRFLETNALKNSKFDNFSGNMNEDGDVSVTFDVYTINFYEAAKQVFVFKEFTASKQPIEGQKKDSIIESFNASDFKINKNGQIHFQASLIFNKNILYDKE